MKKKQALRIGTFLAILMFLLVPLLSQPVAAAFHYYSEGATNNTPSGPTATAYCPPPYSFIHESEAIAVFEVWYHFKDTHYEGSGSWHQARIRATLLPSGTPKWGDSTNIFLEPGEELFGHAATDEISYTAPASWKVDVFIDCYDNDAGYGSLVVATDTTTVTVS